MDFSKALEAKTTEKRDKLIEDEIFNADWGDTAENHLRHGGWPDDVQVSKITIKEEEDGKAITVNVEVSFVESRPSSCNDITYDHKGWAQCRIDIDSKTKTWEVEDLDGHVGEWGESDNDDNIYEGDYY